MRSFAYVHHRRKALLELLRAGSFRREAGFLGLGQELRADAAANCYFLSDLAPVLERFGNRGYRAAQLEPSALANSASPRTLSASAPPASRSSTTRSRSSSRRRPRAPA